MASKLAIVMAANKIVSLRIWEPLFRLAETMAPTYPVGLRSSVMGITGISIWTGRKSECIELRLSNAGPIKITACKSGATS
jgi:hypothetical protein